MTFQYLPVEEAIPRPGLRMVVVGNVPSLWGEAAKGILHIKNIEWAAVRLAYHSEPLKQWTGGQLSGPVAVYEQERPRSGWAEILLLAERLAPTRSAAKEGWAGRAACSWCTPACRMNPASPHPWRSTWRRSTATVPRPARPAERA